MSNLDKYHQCPECNAPYNCTLCGAPLVHEQAAAQSRLVAAVEAVRNLNEAMIRRDSDSFYLVDQRGLLDQQATALDTLTAAIENLKEGK